MGLISSSESGNPRYNPEKPGDMHQMTILESSRYLDFATRLPVWPRKECLPYCWITVAKKI